MAPAERTTGQPHLDRQALPAANNPRVSFIGIGAQKCASTWLHDVLSQHPLTCMPTGKKEVDFFSHHYDFGFQWYERHFAGSGSRLAGEISPSYLHAPGIAERVAHYNPGMRIILIVREPLSRALSNHKHEVRTGHFQGTDLSFEAGLRNNPSYVEQGLYARHLRRWLDVFPREQILVLRFDEVLARPGEIAELVCNFLAIGALPPEVDINKKSNESYLVRSSLMEQAKNLLRGTLRSLRLGKAWELLGNSGLRARYRQANRVAPERTIGTPTPQTLEALNDIFKPDIEELERLTGLVFDEWR